MGGASRVSEPSSAQSERAAIAWSSKLQVVGQPVEAGPALLVLARSGGSIELVSLDKATGKTNFTTPFHPGGQPTGVAMTPRATETDAGRHLAIVRRAAIGAAGPALVAIDVRTGATVASTPVALDDYDACSDGTDVCWSGYDSRPGELAVGPFGTYRETVPGSGPVRWDLESGRAVENTSYEGARLMGEPDLYEHGDGRTASLMRLTGTRERRWSQPVSVAVADGVDPDRGWSFEHDPEENVYVGAMGKTVPPKLIARYNRGQSVSLDYQSRYVIAGIDGRTGEHLWQRKGADAWCSLARSLPETGARTLCVVSGTRVDEKGEKTTYQDLEVELQGVDPRTGDVRWTFTLTGKDAERAYVDRRAPLAPSGVVLPSADGPVALDEATGDLETVADDTVVLCAAGPDTVTAYGKEYSADTLFATCGPDGTKVDGDLSVFGASALSGEGDTRFVSMPGKVVAYEVG